MRQQEGPRQLLKILTWTIRLELSWAGEPVYDGDQPIGYVTKCRVWI